MRRQRLPRWALLPPYQNPRRFLLIRHKLHPLRRARNLAMMLLFSFYMKCFSLGDLFAGKLHALLYRSWQNRVKGRDWYDFEWYVRHRHVVHLEHFLVRAQESGELSGLSEINLPAVQALLHERIARVDFEQAKADVRPFIRDVSGLELWSEGYFGDLVQQMRIV